MGELIRMKTYFKKQVKKNAAKVKQDKKDIELFKKCFSVKGNYLSYDMTAIKQETIAYVKIADFLEINFDQGYITIAFSNARSIHYECGDIDLAKEFMDWFIAKIGVQ
jgi:hypothetical protein